MRALPRVPGCLLALCADTLRVLLTRLVYEFLSAYIYTIKTKPKNTRLSEWMADCSLDLAQARYTSETWSAFACCWACLRWCSLSFMRVVAAEPLGAIASPICSRRSLSIFLRRGETSTARAPNPAWVAPATPACRGWLSSASAKKVLTTLQRIQVWPLISSREHPSVGKPRSETRHALCGRHKAKCGDCNETGTPRHKPCKQTVAEVSTDAALWIDAFLETVPAAAMSANSSASHLQTAQNGCV